MMNDDMDDLDRALFALPLATPPDGLRAAILGATVFAPARVTVPIARAWEMWVGGIALAVAAWLCVALVAYKGFAAEFNANIDQTVRAFGEPSTIVWFAGGLVVTAALLYVSDRNFRLPLRGARS